MQLTTLPPSTAWRSMLPWSPVKVELGWSGATTPEVSESSHMALQWRSWPWLFAAALALSGCVGSPAAPRTYYTVTLPACEDECGPPARLEGQISWSVTGQQPRILANSSAYFPDRALRMALPGRAVLQCDASRERVRNCRVVEESPEAYHFGEAALKAADTIRIASLVDDTRLDLVFDFRIVE